MNRGAGAAQARWLVATLGAAVIVAAVAALFRFPAPAVVPPLAAPLTAAKSDIGLTRASAADVLLKQENELADLRPLFLPTALNATLPEPKIEPGRTFLDNENVRLRFSETELQIAKGFASLAPNEEAAENRNAIAAAVGYAADAHLTLGIGRRRVEVTPIPRRGGFLEIVGTRDGVRVLAEDIPAEAAAPTEKPWGPVEFLAAVDAAGLSGPLVTLQGSQVEEVDAYFRNFLARTYRVGERLAPGLYRITIAP